MPKRRNRIRDHIPRFRTGGPPNTRGRKAFQDAMATETSVEEQVCQCESCVNEIASITSMEEQKLQTEVCETEVTESSPKKRRRKRDKVLDSKENTVKLTTEDSS
jgi:hypothetical protein